MAGESGTAPTGAQQTATTQGQGQAGVAGVRTTPMPQGFQFIDTGTVSAREQQEQESNPDNSQDNNGQAFDGAAFWNGPEDEGSTSSNTNSPAEDSTTSGQPGNQSPQNPVDALNKKIEQMDFGVSDFTEAEVNQINQGDNSPLTDRIKNVGQEAVRQTIMTMAPMMQQMQTGIMEAVQSEISKSFKTDKAEQVLQRDILDSVPAENRASVKPVAEAVFAQALKNSKGDTAAASQQTKVVIGDMVKGLAGSLDLTVAAPNSGQDGSDNQSMAAEVDWTEFAGLTRK